MLFPSALLSSLLLIPTWMTASVARQAEDPQACEDLLPDFSAIPNKTSSGHLMILGTVQVVEGKEARWEEIISNIKAYVETGVEPSTLTYRATRIVDQNGNPTGNYTNIEEYTGTKS
ncbi:hypothetical protein D9758_009024 [Tetrapyrgos nigripes]|uniref:Uncharacterized protein n=1 Tax=Tetrapyrgos nigripes TaxID=182062 RepID=A0A8H5GAG5_9AGAR|nr:hypothetical protein D9758_009024 [Tetrapyrgos nigripes]